MILRNYTGTTERIVREEGRILVTSHVQPDGDSVGSSLATYLFLKKLNKNVEIVIKDNPPPYLDFLPAIDEIKDIPSFPYDLTLLVDSSAIKRTGFDIDLKDFGFIIRIDHHLTGEVYSSYDLLDDEAPSCGMIVYEMIKNYDKSLIDKDIATLLFTALSTDTGSFKFLNKSKKVFEVAQHLVDIGADAHYIAQMVYQRKSIESLKVQAYAINNMKFDLDGKIVYVVISEEDLKSLGATVEETDSIANVLLSIDGVLASVKMVQNGSKWNISFRGKGEVDLSLVAERLGGGGHRNSAGVKINGEKDEIIEKVLGELKREFNHA